LRSTDDSTVSNGDLGQEGHVMADPDIVSGAAVIHPATR
jgi:hypothetical protein